MEDRIKILQDKQSDLRAKKVKVDDIKDEMKLDKEIAQLEIKIIDLIYPQEGKKLFAPQNANKIKAVSLEKVGLNYIPLIKGAYNILAGRGGSGKSAVALKSMLLWLKDNPTKTSLAFFTEDGIEEIKSRTKMICSSIGLDYNDLMSRIHFVSLDNDDRIKWASTSRDGYVVNDNYIEEVIKFCQENKTEYIILDPLKRFHRLSENSNDDMDVLVRDVFTKIAVETNAVVLVLHHSAKSADGGARGAGTITDSARMAWKIGRYYIRDDSHEIVENPDKKGLIKLEVIKDNMGIETLCTIRGKDGSIANPLNTITVSYEPNNYNGRKDIAPIEEIEYKNNVEMPIPF